MSNLGFENACLKNARKPLRKQKLKVNKRMRSLESIITNRNVSANKFEIAPENVKFYLKMKNKLPNEKRRANFLAFSISTGM